MKSHQGKQQNQHNCDDKFKSGKYIKLDSFFPSALFKDKKSASELISLVSNLALNDLCR